MTAAVQTHGLRRWLLPSVTVVSLGGLLFVAQQGQRDGAAQSRAAAELSEQVHALKAEVARLHTHQQPKIFVVSQEARPAPTAALVAEAPRAEGPSASPEQRAQEAAERMDAQFEAERVDGEWSVGMSRRLRDAVAVSAPQARVVDVACASTLCRLVLSHEGEDDQRALPTSLQSAEAFHEGVFFAYDHAATPPETTLYVLRKGQAFRSDAVP